MENFRQPNFSLVAEILTWLIQRYDPSADIVTNIETEQDRVIFIKSAAQLMATKAHIKLNTKKLYGADGYAVKELLKITSVLYSAMRSNEDKTGNESESTSVHNQLISKSTDLKACCQLVTTNGANLYKLLIQEVGLREARLSAISRSVDIDEIERGIENSIAAVNAEIQRMNQRMDNAASDEASLEVKIEKKRQELERKKKRLQSLANVRPAYMYEYERLESKLQRQYEFFVDKFRNLVYLELQLEDHKQVEQDRQEQQEHTLVEMKLQVQQENDKTLNDAVIQNDTEEQAKTRFVGNMTGEGIASDEGSASLSSGSRNGEEMLGDLQEEEEGEFVERGHNEEIDSDGDF